jgi:hypothetical protein
MPRTPKWERDLGLAIEVLKLAKRKKRRKRRMVAMTQAQAARELGVTQTSVGRYRAIGLLKEFIPGTKLVEAGSVYKLKGTVPRRRGRPRKVR